jgi:hypothetical protein
MSNHFLKDLERLANLTDGLAFDLRQRYTGPSN